MPKRNTVAYPLFMLALCIFSLLLLMMEVVYGRNPEIVRILRVADVAVCLIFLFDFALSLARAENRWRYLITWGWIDLLSSLPALDLARWGRLARIARILRVLRALRVSRTLTTRLFRERSQSAALAAALMSLFLVVGGSAAVLHVEDHADANIKDADDAIWWAVTTITTVGYGDRYPTTPEGRFIAAVLMTAGVGLFGALSGALAAWFLAPEDQATGSELNALREEIAQLRAALVAAKELPPGPG